MELTILIIHTTDDIKQSRGVSVRKRNWNPRFQSTSAESSSLPPRNGVWCRPSQTIDSAASSFSYPLMESCRLMSCGCYGRPSHFALEETATNHQKKSNLNMLSAFVHVIGDTLRTLSVFIAAAVSTIFAGDGDLCDAWAAIITSVTILVMCISLLRDMRTNYRSLNDENEEEVEVSSNGIKMVSIGPQKASRSETSSRQVQKPMYQVEREERMI